MAVKLELKGFGRVRRILNPVKFNRYLKKNVKRVNRGTLSPIMEQLLTKSINEEKLRNHPLTVAIKGRDEPLVESGFMRDSVGSRHFSAWGFDTGVERTGRKGANVALIVHNGATIKVTEKIRKYFKFLASIHPNVKPISKDKTQIVIKPRPFMTRAFNNKFTGNICVNEWLQAVRKTIIDLGGKPDKEVSPKRGPKL